MNVLVFNCGSSSLKYKLIAMPAERQLCGGECQGVGPPTAKPPRIVHRVAGEERVIQASLPDHGIAFDQVMRLLSSDKAMTPDAIGHRMVHGGGRFLHHAVVDDEVMQGLLAVQDLAPLHNPPATALVRACRDRAPGLPQVCVFDTVYHATIPAHARAYALPRDLAERSGFAKFGFHGISHEFVAAEAATMLGKPLDQLNAVSCHLGSGGASLCAIVAGRSVDNTMGYSPLQGLVMSTRCGDLDAAIVLHLLQEDDDKAVEALLNQRSGVLGMSGATSDIRDVLATRRGTGDDRQARTADAYLWRLRKYLGAYLAIVGRADAVIFTDTIGELSPAVRQAMCGGLHDLGVDIDAERNRGANHLPVDIAADDSPVRLLVIATNEELSIARATHAALTRPPTAIGDAA